MQIRQAGDGAIRSPNLRATESGSPPAAWIQDTPPRRTLPIHQNSAGGIPGKRGEESQEEFTSSVGLRPRVGKTKRGIAGRYFVSRPGPSKRLPGPRGSAGVQRAAFQIAAGAVAGTSGSGIRSAAERSKYVRQATAPYEAQTIERTESVFPGALSHLTRLPGPRGSAIVQRAASSDCSRRRRRHQRIRDPCRGRAKQIRQAAMAKP